MWRAILRPSQLVDAPPVLGGAATCGAQVDGDGSCDAEECDAARDRPQGDPQSCAVLAGGVMAQAIACVWLQPRTTAEAFRDLVVRVGVPQDKADAVSYDMVLSILRTKLPSELRSRRWPTMCNRHGRWASEAPRAS